MPPKTKKIPTTMPIGANTALVNLIARGKFARFAIALHDL
jgi:hypothetical protein